MHKLTKNDCMEQIVEACECTCQLPFKKKRKENAPVRLQARLPAST